jgi:hypothetical protein
MQSKLNITLLLLLILFILTACGSTPEETPAAASPPAASPPAGEATDPAAPPATAATAETTGAEATPTAPAASAQAATAVALSNVNLRGGPGTNYAIVGNLPAEGKLTVVGRNEASTWLAVQTESGQAWITGDPSLVKVEGQTISELPVIESPALAYDPGNANVARLLNEIPLVLHNPGSFTCVSHAGINNLMPLAEGNVIGPHAGDFVMGSDNVLFKYISGSLHLIRENPVARFEGGAETLPFDRAMQMFQNGEIVWTGHLGQAPGRGVTGCDPAIK